MDRRVFTNQDKIPSWINNTPRQCGGAKLQPTAGTRPPFVRPAGRHNMANKSYACVLSNSLRTSAPLVQRSGAVTSINGPQAFPHEVVNAREHAWNSTDLKTMRTNNQTNWAPFMSQKQQNQVPDHIRPSTSETIRTTTHYDQQTNPSPSSEWLTAGGRKQRNKTTHKVNDTVATTSHSPTMKNPSANKPNPLASNQSANPRLKNNRNRGNKNNQSAASPRNSSVTSEGHSRMPSMSSMSGSFYSRDENSGHEKSTPVRSPAPTMKKPSTKKTLFGNQSIKPKVTNSRNRSKKKSQSASSSRNSSAASERHSGMPLMWSISDLLNSRDENSGQGKFTPLKPINENRVEKIGKVREFPKVKRPTRLKRTILTERSSKTHARCSSAPGTLRYGDSMAPTESENDKCESESVPVKEVLGVALATETATTTNTVGSQVVCQQLSLLPVNKVQDELVSQLITQLRQFQDRAYVKYAHTPYHRKRTRRLVCGLREVVKHLRLHNLRMIFLARDLERGASHYCSVLRVASISHAAQSSLLNQSFPTLDTRVTGPGSPEQIIPTPTKQVEETPASPVLEDVIKTIWDLATSPGDGQALTPILMTQNRRVLGKLCHKPSRVSIVGVLSIAGGDEVAQRLLALNSAINIPPSPSAGGSPVGEVIGGNGEESRE